MKMQQYLTEEEDDWRRWASPAVITPGLVNIRINEATVTELPHGMPRKVSQYAVLETGITTLHGSPESCSAVSVSKNKKLRSLLGGPSEVITTYHCYGNSLETLQGAPESCTTFSCHNNLLTSFMHAPKKVRVSFMGQKNPVTTLHGIGVEYLKHVEGGLELNTLPVKSHALGLLLITGKPWIHMDFLGSEIIAELMAKADKAGHPRADYVIDCQHALIEAGFEDLALL